MTQRAVIFDHDGVMVDTEPLHSQAWIDVLHKYGATPEPYESGLVHIAGVTIEENWKILKSVFDFKESVDLLEEQRGRFYIDFLRQAKPMPGLETLLRILRGEKQKSTLKMAIGSSSHRKYIEAAVRNFGFDKDFDSIVSGQDVSHGKPAPDIYLKAACDLGVSPENCLVLEDTITGVIAAKAAGMKVIAIPNAYTKGSDFSKADRIVGSLGEIDLELVYSVL